MGPCGVLTDFINYSYTYFILFILLILLLVDARYPSFLFFLAPGNAL